MIGDLSFKLFLNLLHVFLNLSKHAKFFDWKFCKRLFRVGCSNSWKFKDKQSLRSKVVEKITLTILPKTKSEKKGTVYIVDFFWNICGSKTKFDHELSFLTLGILPSISTI